MISEMVVLLWLEDERNKTDEFFTVTTIASSLTGEDYGETISARPDVIKAVKKLTKLGAIEERIDGKFRSGTKFRSYRAKRG